MERTIDISEAIDQIKIGAFQTGILILCALCLIMDGFDVQALGYLAPAIIKDWSLPPAQMGPVLSAALVGILVGSLLFSMLADRFGRRPVLIVSTLFFSLITLWTGLAASISELRLARFIAGVGLGGIMPNAVALVGEYTPRRRRVLMMIVVSNGFNVGAIVAGLVSARMIPLFGWRSVFYFGAVLPLVIGLIMLVLLPESLQFLAVRGMNSSKLRKWLGRINREAAQAGNAKYVVREEKAQGMPLIHLFYEGRAIGTSLLWIINFMNMLNLYFMASWLPTVVSASYSIQTSDRKTTRLNSSHRTISYA